MKKLYRGSYIDASCQVILVFDWLMLNKSSPLKLLDQIKTNFAGSIYVRSSIETRIALGSHIFWPIGMKRRNLMEDLT
jgi:hypothetical protein